MGIFLLAGAGICALAGAWLLFDFFLWFFTGTVVPGKIEEFDKRKPVISFETPEGKKYRETAARIMHMGYFLTNPQAGDIFNVIYRDEADGLKVRVFGYLYLVAGTILFIPLVGGLALEYSRAWLGGQVAFIAIFAGLVLLAWVFLKFVRRNY